MFTANQVNKCQCSWPCLRQGTHSVLQKSQTTLNNIPENLDMKRFCIYVVSSLHSQGWERGGGASAALLQCWSRGHWIYNVVPGGLDFVFPAYASSVWLNARGLGAIIVTLSRVCRIILIIILIIISLSFNSAWKLHVSKEEKNKRDMFF